MHILIIYYKVIKTEKDTLIDFSTFEKSSKSAFALTIVNIKLAYFLVNFKANENVYRITLKT